MGGCACCCSAAPSGAEPAAGAQPRSTRGGSACSKVSSRCAVGCGGGRASAQSKDGKIATSVCVLRSPRIDACRATQPQAGQHGIEDRGPRTPKCSPEPWPPQPDATQSYARPTRTHTAPPVCIEARQTRSAQSPAEGATFASMTDPSTKSAVRPMLPVIAAPSGGHGMQAGSLVRPW